jgi:hypothetical protein
MTRDDRLAELACEFADRVGHDDPEDNLAWLLQNAPTERDLVEVCFTLAAPLSRLSWIRMMARRNTVTDDGIVDEIAVERACRGEHVPLTLTERRAVVETLLRRSTRTPLTAREIANRSGMSVRQVVRVRNRDVA